MKTLLIMRHAKSSWSSGALSDHDRPLNGRGKRDAPRMGELLKEIDLVPDLIVTSTAKRARTTAELVGESCGYAGEYLTTRLFYHAGVEEYLDGLQAVPEVNSVVMIVGHNPGMAELVEHLSGEPEMLTTANIAVVKLDVPKWINLSEETEGELVRVWRPKEL
jgi:phosphohistidine phosphatase